MPEPKYIEGSDILYVDLNEFWIKRLEVQAEMEHSVEEKCQV